MKKLKLTLLLLLIPAMAFAHGEETIIPFFILFVSFLLFIAFISSVKIPSSGKLLLTMVYLSTVFSASVWVSFSHYDYYLRNMESINVTIAVVPPFAVMLTYFILDKRYSKQKH